MNDSQRTSSKPSPWRRAARVAGWIPELLIDPLHTVEGTIAVVGWVMRMCRSPKRRTMREQQPRD